MESLYRKYRPLTFESVVGQQHIVSTLQHAVAEGRLSHAYLFCGPRGTGKTTMARILAKSLLCEHAAAARAEGASGCMPDGTCPECEAIAAGTHPDVYELDAASRTGVDNVREEIISSVSFAPVRGAYKVYIIDEVHMLTAAAFNALLKTLEEPPAHVVFILCTTDPQKILETILSRCQRFDFHRIGNDDIVRRLREVCDAEGFEADDEALEIVARHARGGMRDALSTLEQLSVFGAGSIRASDARSLLGETASNVLAEFARGIAQRDVVGLFTQIRAQVEHGGDLLEFCRDAVAHVRDVYMACVAGANPDLFDCTPDEVHDLAAEAKLFGTADRLARVLTVLDDAAIEMRTASDARLVLEIAVTRLARPESDLTLEALAERLDKLEAQVASGASIAAPEVALPAAGTAARAESEVRGAAPSAARASKKADTAQPTSVRSDVPWARGAQMPASQEEPAPAGVSAAKAERADRARDRVASGPASPAPDFERDAVVPSRAQGSVGADRAPSPADSQAQPASSSPAPSAVRASAPHAPSPCVANAPQASDPAVLDAGELQRKWADAVKRVVAAQASRGALLQSARATADDGSVLTVSFPKGSNFAMKMLGRADSQAVVLPIICEVFGTRTVEYVTEGAAVQASVPARAAKGVACSSADAASQADVPAPVVRENPVAPPASPSANPAASSKSRSGAGSAVAHPTGASDAASSVAGASGAAARSGATCDVAPQNPVSASASVASSAQDAHIPQAPSSQQPEVHQVSGPTVVAERDIEADRRAWEDEQVPYDDATVDSYVAGGHDSPFDDSGFASGPVASEPVASPSDRSVSPGPSASPSDAALPASAPLGAAPWENSAFASSDTAKVPQTEDEAKDLLNSVWGAGVVFKDSQ